MAEKYIDEDDIRQILEDVVKKIKVQMKVVHRTAIKAFYSSPHPSYRRTNSFFDVVSHEPEEEYDDNGCLLTYRYSSSDVTVNNWRSPWGIQYPGEPEHAFTTAFEYGFHGGPTPINQFGDSPSEGGWTWEHTRKTTPIMDLIQQGINRLEL